ncbi:uncharacterized protein LOC128198238, partial [Bicyclus anynana]|uniref:Uncharacterized protein LOC128198238 n=1 Tax=Bicyclus anynana TaxID=110368 RepID=A0ABM3LHC5_BICAN
MDTVKPLSIYYQNVRGLRTKSHDFLSNILNCDYDIICITESWLNDSFYSSEFFDNRFEVFRCDRDPLASGSARGGGVIVAVRRSLQPSEQSGWRAPPPADEVWVSVPLRARELHIGCTYIPHGNHHQHLLTSFYDRSCDIIHAHTNDVFLIIGDFNVTHAEWYYDDNTNSMNIKPTNELFTSLTSDFMNLSLLSQFSSELNINNRLLDLVFCNETCTVTSCLHPLVSEDSHHKSLDIEISLNKKETLKSNTFIKKMFYKSDFDNINLCLNSIDWDKTFSTLCAVESRVNYFYEILYDLINKYVPQRVVRDSYKYPPWYTRSLIKVSNEKRKYHGKWKTYGNHIDYIQFSYLRRRFRKMERDCYNTYNIISEDRIRYNPNFFWSYVKSKYNNSDIPEKMIFDSKIYTHGNDICTAFNTYFHSVFIPQTNNCHSNTTLPVHCDYAPIVDINSINLNDDIILKELKSVNIRKSAGYDNIHPILISRCATALLKPISYIFRASIESGIFPNIWKQALITPIPKNTQKHLITQYKIYTHGNDICTAFNTYFHSVFIPQTNNCHSNTTLPV